MRALIVDDEAPARDELGWLLEQADESIEVVAQAASAKEALGKLDELDDNVDLIFLDVDMPVSMAFGWPS